MSLDLAKLKETFEYLPETGEFIQKVRTSNRVKVGDVAGGRTKAGYVSIYLDGKRYYAHRLAWAYVHGCLPVDQIDHINGDKGDNRIENLRLATLSQNNWNKGATKRSSSGKKGVYWDSCTGKWVARICFNRRHINLGRYETIELASGAYQAFAKQAQGQFFREEASQ